MILTVWAILFAVAILTTAYSLFAEGDNAALLFSNISLGLWIILSYGALNLEIHSDDLNEFVTVNEPAVSILCLGAVGICVINTLVILFDWANVFEGLTDP